jgi:hypothetical protein
MAVSFDWLGIAEGSTNDARGALTLVGVGQNVMAAVEFPHREQRVLIVTVLDEDGTDLGQDATFGMTFDITAPSGRVLIANHQTLTTAQASNPAGIPPDIPARGIQLVWNLNLEVTEYGPHTVRVEIEIPGQEPLSRTRKIYVVAPPGSSPESLAPESPL